MDPLTGKMATTAGKELRNAGSDLLGRLLGPTFDDWGQLLKERFAERRRRNAERVAARAEQLLPIGRLVTPIHSTRLAIALIQGASLEDEGSPLEEKWAALLASAAMGDDVPVAYASILGEMSPEDARLLHAVANHASESNASEIRNLAPAAEISPERALASIDNLLRLRLVALSVPQTGSVVKRAHLAIELTSTLDVTALGNAFLRACSRSRPSESR